VLPNLRLVPIFRNRRRSARHPHPADHCEPTWAGGQANEDGQRSRTRRTCRWRLRQLLDAIEGGGLVADAGTIARLEGGSRGHQRTAAGRRAARTTTPSSTPSRTSTVRPTSPAACSASHGRQGSHRPFASTDPPERIAPGSQCRRSRSRRCRRRSGTCPRPDGSQWMAGSTLTSRVAGDALWVAPRGSEWPQGRMVRSLRPHPVRVAELSDDGHTPGSY
jgi:hypothetical protein